MSETRDAYGAFAKVYDHLMEAVDYDAWYAHYRALFKSAGVGDIRRVADLCCGTGQFAMRLAKDYRQVIAIDRSQEMLAVAQENMRAAGRQAQFACMDASKFSLHRPVDAILCGCDGINYLTGKQQVQSFFARCHENLRPGGVIGFDFSTAYKLEHILGGQAFGEDMGDTCYLWRNDYDKDQRLCYMELILFMKTRQGLYEKHVEEHIQRAHTGQELAQWLEEAGFGQVKVFSEMTTDVPTPSDQRQHVVAVRGI